MIALPSLFLKITYNKRTVFFHWPDICSFALKNVLQKNHWHNFWATSWPLSSYKVWSGSRVMECFILGQKTAYSPWRRFFFFWKIIITNFFMYLLASFHYIKFKKIPLQQIESYDHTSFLCPKWWKCPKGDVFGKTTNTIYLYHVATFIVQNF